MTTYYFRYKNEETKEVYAHTDDPVMAKTDNLNLTTDQKAVLYRDRLYLENEVQKMDEEKAEDVRNTRDMYLVLYIDPVVSNPLRWVDMTTEEQKQYVDYRCYLLDITEDPTFPDVTVKTFDEFVELTETKVSEVENDSE